MKHCLLLFFFCLIQGHSFAQTQPVYASVRISLQGKDMATLTNMGVETDHGQYSPGRYITVVLSDTELAQVQAAGFQTQVLIPDLTKHYLEQCAKPVVKKRDESCEKIEKQYVTPINYSYGSMGGYLSYNQMMIELDKMRALYPGLISARTPVSDTILTWKGNAMYNVKISDNPDVDEAEPQVLYTALHHAREPNSASQLIFFMWYLLENYNTKPDIKALVDNLELYFIPCINVDGYLFNEQTNPQGGGYWRKNRRLNDDGTYGVDLNRNYGFYWGDFGGSSATPASETYRGPEAFSEPESRMVRDFCLAHDFLFAYNYHAHGNLFIYPWAYSDVLADSAFVKYARYFTRESHYRHGTSIQTVGYRVNGSSDDWMFAEKGTYVYTPEIGTTGFWPMPSEIDALNKQNLWHNLSMAYSALLYGESKDLSGVEVVGLEGSIKVGFTRYGLQDGAISVSLEPFSSNIISGPVFHSFDIENLTKSSFDFPYQLDPGIQEDEEVIFLLKTNNGLWTSTDTLKKQFAHYAATTVIVFRDTLTTDANWSGDWGLTNETYYSAPSCMTDSPGGLYEQNALTFCSMVGLVDIPANALTARLRFFAKWDLEEDRDYVQVYGFADNSSQALCGLYTEEGYNSQLDGPVFDGIQGDWVEEDMDLSSFIGKSVKIHFFFGSNEAVEADGFYFDDLRIEYTLPTSGTKALGLDGFQLLQNEPNPASGRTVISWAGENIASPKNTQLLIYNVFGQEVDRKTVNLNTEKSVTIDTRNLAPGIYSYLLRNDQGQSRALKMTVVR